MRARMLSQWVAEGLARITGRQHSRRLRSKSAAKRRWNVSPNGCDSLEIRRLQASNVAGAFESATGQITSVGQSSQVSINLSAGEVQSDTGRPVVVGFSVTPTAGSTVSPQITGVDGPSGKILPITLPRRAPFDVSDEVAKNHFFARVTPSTTQAQSFTVKIAGQNNNLGGYTVQANLPGDVNGDLTVNNDDFSLIQKAYGSAQGQTRYNSAADFNGDGRVGCIDLYLANLNRGASIHPTTQVAAATITNPVIIPAVATTPAPTPTPANPPANLDPQPTTVGTSATTSTTASSAASSAASAASGSASSSATSSSAASSSAASSSSASTSTTTSATSTTAATTPITTTISTPSTNISINSTGTPVVVLSASGTPIIFAMNNLPISSPGPTSVISNQVTTGTTSGSASSAASTAASASPGVFDQNGTPAALAASVAASKSLVRA